MLNIITKGIAKVFGTKADRDMKDLLPYVDLVNEQFITLANISDEDLRGKTQELKDEIAKHLQSIDDNMSDLHKQVEDNPEMDIVDKETIFNKIDALEKDRDVALEEKLLEILPMAFAIMKDTARRLTENKKLTVKATMMDKMLAAKKSNVEIQGDTAIWHHKWLASGVEVVWNMIHYDVQLVGGVVLHQGKVAEMATGEGKTLVATLPAFLNGLSGRGVHVITVNDYLAKRDAEWNAPLFEFHGLKVACIDNFQASSPERKAAYQCDIIYGTNNEFGFDYLRDNMARHPDELMQGKHHFAMIDEVDSVLIDDARTPLIISGPIPRGDEHEFYELKPRINKLVEAQKKTASQFLNEAKKKIAEGNEDEGGLALFRAFRGLPKYKPLIKYLSETGIRQVLQKTENIYLADNQKLMPQADAPLFFTIDEKTNGIELTDQGIDLITGEGEDENFFILPDIGSEIAQLEQDSSLSETEMLHKKEDLIRDYSVKGQRIHSVNQLLKAYTLFEKDTEYIVVEDKVKIVDEQTGRVMDGRRYSDGLHQAIEAKENVKVEDATQTYATITLQNYFRLYHKLSGMTGTAQTEAGELMEIYKLDVIVIPTNRPITRKDMEDKVYKTLREKFNAVADEIVALTDAGRPVLVGTTSVEISEVVSRMLNMKKIKHQVLNAKQHAREAEVVAEAGLPGAVTIATNMAGRGTDIKLSSESKAAGGLAIIGTERHESRRVDRQLRGRSGRQGDVGSSQFFVCLEDNLMRLFGSDRIARIMDRLGLEEGEVIQHSMITKSIERAQTKVEENNFAVRKNLLEYDDVMNSQREVIYARRKNALYGERLDLDILNMMYDTSDDIAINAKALSDYESFKLNCLSILGIDTKTSNEDFSSSGEEELGGKLYNESLAHYQQKNKMVADRAIPVLKNIQLTRGATVKEIMIPFSDGKKQIGVVASLEESISSEGRVMIKAMEKMIALSIIDQSWKEPLREMDDLKQSVRMAVHEQKDPLLIYKFESFEMFKQFLARVNEDTISFLSKAEIAAQEPNEVQEARQQRAAQNYNESKADSGSALAGNNRTAPVEKTAPIKSDKVHGRNDRVSVQYSSGEVKKDVKFKSVELDVANGDCVVIE
jgi:preprotein translocase subunit SecA